MQIKGANYKIKGMSKDLSYSAFNPEYSYHNKNIRLTARDSNNLLAITNEKGNLLLNTSISIMHGKVLGSCTINDYIILFTKDVSYDYIYRILISGNSGTVREMFKGDLNFDELYKIQALPFYENDSIQKVYWIDGKNQPRVINIKDETTIYNDKSFDFIQDLSLSESVSITKQTYGGVFKSGVIQYAFTYFNKNGSESNIFYITPIQYVSPLDRGGKVDETVINSFKIDITNLETKFEYVRIYSVFRTSLDATPEVKSVVDLKTSNGSISFVDTNAIGSSVSSDVLLYIGGEEIVPKCMTQKNNTLFLGNIELKNKSIAIVKISDIPNKSYTFEWLPSDPIRIESNFDNSLYSYKPKLDASTGTKIAKHWKFDETYRLGIQGQYSSGAWSSVIWLDNNGVDQNKVDKRYETYTNSVSGGVEVLLKYIYGKLTIGSEIKSWFQLNGFVKIRPVYVPLSYNDRHIIAQGLVTNTIASMENRHIDNVSTSVFSYPDYMIRFNDKKVKSNTFNGSYAHFDLLKLNNGFNPSGDTPNKYIEVMGNFYDGEYYNISDDFSSDYKRDFLIIDKNIVNIWSPDILHNSDTVSQYINNVDSVGLYGFAFGNACVSKLEFDSGRIGDFRESPVLSYNQPNYSTLSQELNTYRNIFPRVWDDTTPDQPQLFPIWTPEHYVTHSSLGTVGDLDITFTKVNKSGYVYFGWNNNLNEAYSSYKYEINTPLLRVDDDISYCKSNTPDNSTNNGNILYSKNTEKTYIASSYWNVVRNDYGFRTVECRSALSVKYNTSKHALFSFKQRGGGVLQYSCMPRIKRSTDSSSFEYFLNPSNSGWYRNSSDGFMVDLIDKTNLKTQSVDPNNTLPIFDLYKPVLYQYGGTSTDALTNNLWIPCGDSVNVSNDPLVLNYTDGDTYITRFDLLRVYPNDLTQIPQHSEIVSFLCESFINIDGRCDTNRYNTDSSLMTTSNYGLLNNIYSQKDNYFTCSILDSERFNVTNFPSTITWSKVKTLGELTDTWTNMSMLSTLDLEGINGNVESLNLWNNELYAFQPKAIARLLYNERVQQSASDGVSIELANGYTVPGYRYLTNQYGCDSKWSIVEGKNGIYFVDKINKSLNLLNSGVNDISNQFGFKSWFNANIDQDFTLSYDKSNKDVYIHSKDYCFNFSETLSSFESFYDYVDKPQMQNINNDFFSVDYDTDSKLSTIWLNNKGEYNKFYGELKPFSVEYIINPDPLNDKVFNTFDYRLDNDDINWNYLNVETYYQLGLFSNSQFESNHKKKFNVHRVQIPRQTGTLNRIRSTWMKLKLSRTFDSTNTNKKFSQQDLNIWYTI